MGQLTFQATLGGAINLAGPNIATTTTFTLPSADGTNGQALTTNGSGTLAFATVAASAATPTALGTVYGKTNTGNATAIGYQALNSTTTADNVGVGYRALYANTSGANNTAMGHQSSLNSVGNNNSSFGYQTLANNQANNCTAMGYQALVSNTTGVSNVAIGKSALQANSTGAYNAAAGYQALFANTTGAANTAFGYSAMEANTTANSNTAVGYTTLVANTTGENITAIGREALYANTTASYCTALGYRALYSNTSANNNTGIGNESLSTSTGASNTGCGDRSGYGLTSGSYNCFFGHYAYGSAAGNSNEIVIGYNSVGKGGSTGFINPGGGGVYQGNNGATWSVTSDQRLKKNIVDNNIGLSVINSIRVRNFEYRVADEVTELPAHSVISKQGVQLGVIAQELQAVLPECVKTESTGVMTVDQDNLTWYMINAIKELKAEFDAYKASHP